MKCSVSDCSSVVLSRGLCRSHYNKAYYDAHRERIGAQIKARVARNPERKRAQVQSWRDRNRARVALKVTEWQKRNPEKKRRYRKKWLVSGAPKAEATRLGIALRSRLRGALKGRFKSGSAVRDLGCSIEEFRSYLELKFQPGMTWANHGRKGWHLDHIKPLAAFDLSDRVQLLEAVHYTNLQPLWWRDNLRKGAS